ncbi:HNH endonuclease [Croceicoccus sp. YJ47]|uniref:HNH endonuclease n=1 Tax=Croceicoccus sp. YJ47 TaxID=2798724 RepID=UPI0035300542
MGAPRCDLETRCQLLVFRPARSLRLTWSPSRLTRYNTVAATKQRAGQLRALRWAQGSLCAGCGEHVPSSSRLKRYDPSYPTFDHVTTRSTGGGRTLGNGLLKHQRCNQKRANRAPTGCDLIWLEFVTARLSMRPKSFKPTFKGGVRNPS